MPGKFSAQHYNAVAKIFRVNFPLDPVVPYDNPAYAMRRRELQIVQGTLADMALEFANYFKDDNPSFDPVKFLDHCTPDVDRYPFSELWSDYGQEDD